MKEKDVVGEGLRIISVVAIAAVLLVLLFSSLTTIETNTISSIWDSASSDAKLIFIGLILAGIIAS